MKGASFRRKSFETHKHRITARLDTLSQNIATSDPSSCRQGHFRSLQVTKSFSAITFDKDLLEQWKHHRCVQDEHTGWLICNMTFFNQVMTLTCGQIFNLTLQGQFLVYSTRLKKRNRMLAKSMSCLYWVKSYCRNPFLQKQLFLEFLLSGA